MLSSGSEELLSVGDPGVLQLQQPPHGVPQISLTKLLVISCPDAHCPAALLFPANHCRKGKVGLWSSGKMHTQGLLPFTQIFRKGGSPCLIRFKERLYLAMPVLLSDHSSWEDKEMLPFTPYHLLGRSPWAKNTRFSRRKTNRSKSRLKNSVPWHMNIAGAGQCQHFLLKVFLRIP